MNVNKHGDLFEGFPSELVGVEPELISGLLYCVVERLVVTIIDITVIITVIIAVLSAIIIIITLIMSLASIVS